MSNYKRQKLEAGYDYNKTATQDSCVACPYYDGDFPCIGEMEYGQCPFIYNFNFFRELKEDEVLQIR